MDAYENELLPNEREYYMELTKNQRLFLIFCESRLQEIGGRRREFANWLEIGRGYPGMIHGLIQSPIIEGDTPAEKLRNGLPKAFEFIVLNYLSDSVKKLPLVKKKQACKNSPCRKTFKCNVCLRSENMGENKSSRKMDFFKKEVLNATIPESIPEKYSDDRSADFAAGLGLSKADETRVNHLKLRIINAVSQLVEYWKLKEEMIKKIKAGNTSHEKMAMGCLAISYYKDAYIDEYIGEIGRDMKRAVDIMDKRPFDGT